MTPALKSGELTERPQREENQTMKEGETVRLESGGWCCYSLSRLIRGSTALSLEAASDGQFLYFSTEDRHRVEALKIRLNDWQHVLWIMSPSIGLY